eukprot:GHRQ01038768.1.p2 GENE.GHRQ01038768.1~~GHRQ01038768.1.p2  ORF type:complete len:167 (+),score=53.31 GHRQ01038768.1:123-623(+)
MLVAAAADMLLACTACRVAVQQALHCLHFTRCHQLWLSPCRVPAAGVSYASAAHAAHQVHQQQQVYAAAVAQHRPAGGGGMHGEHKPAHEQLADMVQQLGLEDELACGDDHLCVVCLEHTRDEVLVPCGHMVLCRFCCQQIMQESKACPVCREDIVDHCTLEPHEV